MLFQTLVLAAAVFATSALAQETASVTIEASHGGADSDLTNTTITIPLNTTYTNVALDEVSNLLLTGATGVPLESITCTPHLYANGTGMAGLAFTSSQPSALSTNTVQVGSITCVSTSGDASNVSSSVTSSTSTDTAIAVPTISNGTALLTTASLSASATSSTGDVVSTVSDATSTFVTTIPASSPVATPQQSTITSVMTASDSDSSPTASATGDSVSVQSASSTSSASPSLSSDNAAGILSSELMWPALAVGALGLAMAV